MRLKNKTNKQKLPLWRQPAASLPSLHPGLSGSLLEPDLPTPGVRVGLGRGAGDRSLLAHTCLAGMQHHLKKERQLLQGNIHHLSWEKVGKEESVLAASEMVCLPPLGLVKGEHCLFEWLGQGKCQDYYRGKTDWANILILSPISVP